MTARSLLNSLPMRNMRRVVGQNKKLMIVICILQALGIPLIAGVLMLEMLRSSLMTDALSENYAILVTMLASISLYSFIGVTCLGAAVISGIIAGITVFQELWKKTKVDMLYALPLTGKQRFFSHYFGGAIIYLLPYIVAVLLGWVIVLGLSIPINFDNLEMTRAVFLMEFAKYYTLGSIGLGLLMWLYYTSTVLIVTCCGTLFESIYTTLLLNVLMPGALAAIIGVICGNVNGFSFEHTWHSIGYTSPLGGLIYLIYILSDPASFSVGWNTAYASQAMGHGMIPSFIRWALVLTVIVTLLLILAWQLYQRRLAESVSKPFIYVGAYYVLLTVFTVLILCMSEVGVLGAAILFSAIVYFVMEVIRKRGFRKFWLTAITYVTTVAVTLTGFWVISFTKGFGRVYYIPAAAAVSSMRIELPSFPDSANLTLEYTDKDVITAIQAVQRDIIADYKAEDSTTDAIDRRLHEEGYMILNYGYDDGKDAYGSTLGEDYYLEDPEEYSPYYYDDLYSYYDMEQPVEDPEDWFYNYADTYRVDITYYTYTGSEIHRSYDVNFDQYIEIMKVLWGTELHTEAFVEYFAFTLRENLQDYRYDENGNGSPYFPSRVMLEVHSGVYSSAYRTFYTSGGESVITELTDCYRRDLEKMTPEDYLNGTSCYLYDLPIWNACTETFAALDNMGMNPLDVSEKYFFMDRNNTLADSDYAPQLVDVRIYAPDNYATGAETYKSHSSRRLYVKTDGLAYFDTYYTGYYTAFEENYPEMYALMEASMADAVYEEDCYMLVVNGTCYVVPPEASDLAEIVIAGGSGSAEEEYFSEDYFDDYYDDDYYYDDSYNDLLNDFEDTAVAYLR